MAAAASRKRPIAISVAGEAAWLLALAVVALVLLCSLREEPSMLAEGGGGGGGELAVVRGARMAERWSCDEIYVVGEGETLHTISDKCGDPFIAERNPHIQESDDVFPGVVLQLNPSKHR